jgi:hypothetical protein
LTKDNSFRSRRTGGVPNTVDFDHARRHRIVKETRWFDTGNFKEKEQAAANGE